MAGAIFGVAVAQFVKEGLEGAAAVFAVDVFRTFWSHFREEGYWVEGF